MNSLSNRVPSVLIADDHNLIVDMINDSLSLTGEFTTECASTYEGVVSAIEKHGSFDIVLLDLEMPGMNGMKGVESVIAANGEGAVVLFSGQARQEAVFRAIELGAKGYIPKTLAAKSLKNAIRFVLAGESFIPSSMASDIAKGSRLTRNSVLNQKELDVLRYICRGDTNKDIARQLAMSEITVKVYVRAICSKLGVNNRTQIAVTAISQGLH